MHLKTLTLKGFKSFASATTLNFEPGITCVVGPNGSGKSNVVDALAWVMGEQGVKSLRGGKMEDVIFAGTSGRPPLGRAEVSLTIDNSDGALPIEYTEVTVTRTMFRSGGSEYQINGSACRLLDVQELLADSGIGREMYVIVGQGQLDTILRATPEDRRGFIEEAAGVLKHRKRKEKALRKLDAMQANLIRLGDLTSEIRRQLGPLGRQAEVARRAQVVQSDVRDARARLLADELAQLTAGFEAEVADESALRAHRAEVEGALAAVRSRLSTLESEAEEAAPRLSGAADTWYRLSSLRERLRGTATLAAERTRLLGSDDENDPDADDRQSVEDLNVQAARAREAERDLTGEVGGARTALEAAVATRTEAEDRLASEERRVAALLRAAADRREGLARLSGQAGARRSRVEAAEAEIGRLQQAVAGAEVRGTSAQQEFGALETQVAGVEEGEEGLDADHERAAAALEEATAEVERWREAERAAERDRAGATARKEALEMGMARKDGSGALLAAGSRLSGVLGSVAALLTVRAGYEDAVAAALGGAADAVAVESVDVAVDAVRLLKDDDAGRAEVLVGGHGAEPPAPEVSGLPDGTVAALHLVETSSSLRPAVAGLLTHTVVVPGLAEARAVVAGRPDLVAVTRDGDVLGATLVRGGSASAPSLLHVQAAVDEAGDALADAVRRGEQARFALQRATAAREEAEQQVEAALDRLHESDARLAAVAEKLGQLGAAARSARAEAERVQRSLAAATESLDADRRQLTELVERLRLAEDAPDTEEPDTTVRDGLAASVAAARAMEMEARLALRTAEERLRALTARAESLERAAARELEARERAARRAEQRRHQAQVAGAVAFGARAALDVLETSLETASRLRDEAEGERAARAAETAAQRETLDGLGTELAALTDSVHRDEVARTQQRLRIESLQARSVDDLGMDPAVLLEEFGPHQMVPPSPVAPGDPEPAAEAAPEPRPFVRDEQAKRLRRAERALAQLGRVNPLALEEFAALEERHKFLTEQLGDLERSRRDLMGIVKEVDERVQQVFAQAFADTAAQFERVFPRLFPGGEGRLVLTDPDDMLATGIEVEARPAGKKVKRLSLLSGGERSLTAVALLVAIFKARPSPFYVLDEVEAALDDTNLGRLITIMEELRAGSQLIVITHQKRTMEVADALYGVTMRGDGVTAVVSQRLREAQPA